MPITVHAQLGALPIERLDFVAPGGNGSGVPIETLEKKGDHDLCGDPGSGAGGLLVRQLAEFEQLFKALEDEFNLPSTTVEVEYVGRPHCRGWKRREQKYEVSCLKRT